MLIWLASYPRSGNGFLRTVLLRGFGRETYTHYPQDAQWIGNLHPQATKRSQLKKVVRQLAAGPNTCFFKTHDLPGNDTYPAIYLVRDGRDCLVSHTWFHLQVDKGLRREDIDPPLFRHALSRLLSKRKPWFGGWSRNVAAWTSRPNTYTLKFESLIGNPLESVSTALEQLGCKLAVEETSELPTFAELRTANPQLYRRGKIGSWQDEFPGDLLAKFWKRHGEVMRQFGYERDAN